LAIEASPDAIAAADADADAFLAFLAFFGLADASPEAAAEAAAGAEAAGAAAWLAANAETVNRLATKAAIIFFILNLLNSGLVKQACLKPSHNEGHKHPVDSYFKKIREISRNSEKC
jgi:hypothetical protein